MGRCASMALLSHVLSVGAPRLLHRTRASGMQVGGAFEVPVVGTGTAPRDQARTEITASPGETSHSSLVFTNPFDETAHIRIELDGDAEAAGLTLIGSSHSAATVAAHEAVSIALAFTPAGRDDVRGAVRVHASTADMGEPAVFSFPIAGLVQAEAVGPGVSLTCRAQHELRETVQLPLTGLGTGMPSVDSLQLRLSCADGTEPAAHHLTATLVCAHLAVPATQTLALGR